MCAVGEVRIADRGVARSEERPVETAFERDSRLARREREARAGRVRRARWSRQDQGRGTYQVDRPAATGGTCVRVSGRVDGPDGERVGSPGEAGVVLRARASREGCVVEAALEGAWVLGRAEREARARRVRRARRA